MESRDPWAGEMSHPDRVQLLMRGSVFEAGGCAPASSERHSGVTPANPVTFLNSGCRTAARPSDLMIGEWRTGSTGKSRTSPAKRSFWLEECCCGHRRGFHREGGLLCTVRGCACAGFITWAEADASRLEEWLTDDSAPRRLMWPFGEFEAQQPGDPNSLPGLASPSAAANRREGEKRFPRRAHNPETAGSTPVLATIVALCRRFSWRGRRLSTGRDGRGAPAASALTRTEHENWGAE